MSHRGGPKATINALIEDVYRTNPCFKRDVLHNWYVKQCLHAIHTSTGTPGVQRALQAISHRANSAKIKNWLAYVIKLLTAFRQELQAGMDAECSEACCVEGRDTGRAVHGELDQTRLLEALGRVSDSQVADASLVPHETSTALPSSRASTTPLSSELADEWDAACRGAHRVAGESPEELNGSSSQVQVQSDGIVFLHGLLAAIDAHSMQLRPWQQQLVTLIELVCRKVLGGNFRMLAIVGSVALALETPGSDIDLVCFTQYSINDLCDAKILRDIAECLLSQGPKDFEGLRASVISDARVPILSVIWMTPLGLPVTVDLGMNLQQSHDHVKWFHRVGVLPDPRTWSVETPPVPILMRCVKIWLRRRGLPRAKEGGLPSIAWLLLVLHSFSECSMVMSETSVPGHAVTSAVRLFRWFFNFYAASYDGLSGVLCFDSMSASSKLERSDTRNQFEVALIIKDPVSGVNLAPPLSSATKLLFAYELYRARALMNVFPSDSCEFNPDILSGHSPSLNSLPRRSDLGFGALVLVREGDGLSTVELAFVREIIPRPGWSADFLHRLDANSVLKTCLLRTIDNAGSSAVTTGCSRCLSPQSFICQVDVRQCGQTWNVSAEGLTRRYIMRRILSESRGLTH
eukprot:TRINITY_DN12793_c0_g6_i1.p1 TRINITY_DN12793_c0_g6~~TRINITY_DN12793_c0_g6_i1.p1  ORF type:complete len:633 (-),score=37.67 TRINITY_DN12793_c0_g6_i1:199-2097(-)